MFRKYGPTQRLPFNPQTLRLLAVLTSVVALLAGGPFAGTLSPAPVAAGAGVWSRMGLGQVQISAIAVDPTNPGIIFSGTRGQGVFRSTDAGVTWNQVNNGLANLFVNDILISPADPTILTVATGRGALVGETTAGIYRSTSRGDSWTSRLTGFVGDLDASAQNSQIIYAAGAPPVFRSTNGGLDWAQAFTNSSLFQNVDMRAIGVNPSDSNTVLVGGATEGGVGSVFRTTDGGQTWTRVVDPTIPAIESIAYSPANSQQVFFGNSLGIWRSRDTGVNWGLVSGGHGTLDLLADRSNPNVLYAGVSGGGVFQSSNGGDSFQTFGTGMGNLFVRALGADRTTPQTIWAGTDDGVWAFTQPAGAQLPALALNPSSGPPGTVVRFSGAGFTPAGRVSLLLVQGVNIVAGIPAADQAGNVSGIFTMPNPTGSNGLSFGPIEVFAVDAATGRQTPSSVFNLSQTLQTTTWYFAEGSTQPPFETWYLVQNPTDTQSRVRFTFFLDDGTTPISEFLVEPHSRFSLFANRILPDHALSARIDADQRVFVERSMFVGFDGDTLAGIASPSTTWLFAEGSTQAPFQTWLLLQNPNVSATTATITYLVQGGVSETQSLSLPPTSRTSIFVNQVLPDAAFSSQVRSDSPIIVERAMYRFPGNAATDVAGANQPSQTWLFAEGNSSAQGLPTDTFLLLQNPNAFAVQTNITAFKEAGGPVAFSQPLPPSSRVTLHLSQMIQGSFGIKVDAAAGIIAERSMFFGTEPRGATSTMGAPTAATTWHLAEGSTAPPFDEVIAILNPNGQDATATIEFELETISTVTRSFTIPAQSKLSVNVDQILPASAVSALINSSIPIVVERTMFMDVLGSVGAAGAMGIQ